MYAHVFQYTNSYVYHSLSNYFNRDNVGLPGFASYYLRNSAEERGHAQLLMDFQCRRGGRVRLATLGAPMADFHDAQRGDALFAGATGR